ncbi:hypothetical protein F5X96DRAFT_214616 [Biscogniauxia mediterranea]|nr:hypothetical protein F5X96DRAFT_214616 [Biscogniauxia mediterranea]
MADHTSIRRFHKSCDTCKARKVRCSGYPSPCNSCIRRKEKCHFSRINVARRPHANIELTTASLPNANNIVPSHNDNTKTQPSYELPDLYIDQMLAQARSTDDLKNHRPFSVKGNEVFVGNYRLTFFSESRLQHISAQLQNNKVDELLKRIQTTVRCRIPRHETIKTSLQAKENNGAPLLSPSEAKGYIEAYFQRVHPVHPFLDRRSFEETISSPNFSKELSQNKAFSALYHAVLALGCQVSGGGSFEPGKGEAWRLFSAAAAVYPDLLTLPDSIMILQALTAMSVYSLCICCMATEHVILSEAARRAQNLRTVKLPENVTPSYHRAFWILYSLDKISSFHFGRTSLFIDHNITVPISTVPESVYDGYDWFLSRARYSRILSRAQTHLLSAGVTGKPKTYYLSTIDQLDRELENWRMSIPANMRPGNTTPIRHIQTCLFRSICVWTHLLYDSFKLSLCRARLQLAAAVRGLVSPSSHAESTQIMLETSRSALELTAFIEVEPSTPFCFIAGIPIVSLFVVFDFVLTYPKHPETNSNLALLDIAGGHFSRIEYASAGWLPGSLITEFSYIAREYVNSLNNNNSNDNRQNAEKPAIAAPSSASSGGASASTSQQEALPIVATDCFSSSLATTNVTPIESVFDIMEMPSVNAAADPAQASSLFTDMMYFPTGDGSSSDVSNGFFTGTDVIELFNSFIPGVDPTLMYPVDGNDQLGKAPV